jgi:hypothetical protein
MASSNGKTRSIETAQALGHEQTVAAVWDRRKKKQKEF